MELEVFEGLRLALVRAGVVGCGFCVPGYVEGGSGGGNSSSPTLPTSLVSSEDILMAFSSGVAGFLAAGT